MFRSLLLLPLVILIVELYVLIQVGGIIGAGWTIFLLFATAVVGVYLLRLQGFQTLAHAQSSLTRGEMPAAEMFDGMLLLLSGFMLLLPGFMTDIVGFLLLIPTLRHAITKHIFRNSRFIFRGYESIYPSGSHYQDSNVIEGEVVDRSDNNTHWR